MIQYCALPECGKEFNNWRVSCCCKSHQAKYAGRMRHGSSTASVVIRYVRKTPMLSAEERKIHKRAWRANRLKIKLKSMPVWADKIKIEKFYAEATRLTKETGIEHHVDHIIPTIHKFVCGLHNEFNLQVLTKIENIRKSNKFDLDFS